jgi:hypothetical protein
LAVHQGEAGELIVALTVTDLVGMGRIGEADQQ